MGYNKKPFTLEHFHQASHHGATFCDDNFNNSDVRLVLTHLGWVVADFFVTLVFQILT